MKIIAHRGNVSTDTENRTEGLLEALNLPYIDGVELDVQQTKDKKFVLSHNEFLKEKEGFFDHIPSHTLKDLKKKEYIVNGKPFFIHTIEEFLKKVTSDKIIMIECKKILGDTKKYGNAFLKAIKKYKKLNIFLCSFSYDLALYLKKKGKYPVGILVGYKINTLKEYTTFDFVAVQYKSLHEKIKKREYYLWTIDNPKQLESVKYNIHLLGIITNKGNLFKKYR
ncbi:MAG: glycerophosphodiester phosphodiesterase family protein [Bacilli bacterium]|nr:glycerophosphodiester phosphodiesterase family protein [Bacilli bacterium]